MIKHYPIYLLALLFVFVGCNETSQTSESDKDSVQVSPYEVFTKKFVLMDSVPHAFNNDNSYEWYNDENVIEDTLFNTLLKDKSYHDFKNEEGVFTISQDGNSAFYYSKELPFSTKYNSFLVSARTENPSHKWRIYLVNFSLAGDFRDAILISYRDSYISTREEYTVRTGAYRTSEFLEGQRIKIKDVVYDNTVDNPSITDPEEKSLEDDRYIAETNYQIRFDGTFNVLRHEEKPQEQATPE